MVKGLGFRVQGSGFQGLGYLDRDDDRVEVEREDKARFHPE